MNRAKILLIWLQAYVIGLPLGAALWLAIFLPRAFGAIWATAQPLSQFWDRGFGGTLQWVLWVGTRLSEIAGWHAWGAPFAGAAMAFLIGLLFEFLQGRKGANDAKPR